jgi:hypothetical protein
MAMNPRLLVPRASFDPDAARYLAAVEAADGQALETPVKRAVDAFFRHTKAAGVFDALKACCILAGARTLAGALVPVVGDAPTNVADGFVSGDYSRSGATPGLKGDGTSYLDTGRAEDDDPEDDYHQAFYVTSEPTSFSSFPVYMGSRASHIGVLNTGASFYVRSRVTPDSQSASYVATGFFCVSRESAIGYDLRLGGATTEKTQDSTVYQSLNHYVFCQNGTSGTPTAFSTARIAFYSLGTSVADLAALDAAVSNLITAIGEAL